MKKVIIIGGGVSGLTAAIYLSRANINTTVFVGYSHGALSTTPLVENFPGFENGISGYDLLDAMKNQAEKSGAIIIYEEIVKIDNVKKCVLSDSGEVYLYDQLIYACGNQHRYIVAKNANKYDSIHYCATCDGAFYKNEDVAVVGGGNTALTEALYLSNICNKVTIIIRRDVFRAEKCLIEKAYNTKNIEIVKCAQIEEFYGDNVLTAIKLNNGLTIDVKGVFVAIGFDKNDKLLIDCFGENYLENITDDIKLCGDIIETRHQAVIASASGAKVAMDIIDEFNNC